MQGVTTGQHLSKSPADLQSRIHGISVPPTVQLPHEYVSSLQQRIQGLSIPPELDADTASHNGSKHAAGGKLDVSSGGKISLHAESQASRAVVGDRGTHSTPVQDSKVQLSARSQDGNGVEGKAEFSQAGRLDSRTALVSGRVRVKAKQSAAAASSPDAQVGFAHHSLALMQHMLWVAPVVFKRHEAHPVSE